MERAKRSVPDPEHFATKDDIARLEIKMVGQFTTLYRYLLGYAAAIIAAIAAHSNAYEYP